MSRVSRLVKNDFERLRISLEQRNMANMAGNAGNRLQLHAFSITQNKLV